MLDVNATWRYAPLRRWLGDAAALVLLTFDVDAETPVLAAGDHYAAHLSTMSHQAYGPKVGLPRILAMLERRGLPATFFFPGLTAERWPGAVDRVLAAGHEVALHGYTHRTPTALPPDEQLAELERGMATLVRAGARPTGYRAPLWSTTAITLSALGRFGLRYDSSLFDDDRPYLLDTPSGRLAELPVHWSLDDWEQYVYVPEPDLGHTISRPSTVAQLWTEELDAMRSTASLCVLTCHPFASGRPSRVAAIERFIDFAQSRGDVAFARADAVAERLLATPEDELTGERQP
jgi:peptidoglycan/xylan/chitin deacetylase (PgdA/CDA1 family)